MNDDKYCIGIVTHRKRFDIFSETLKEIRKQTPADIFVGINGDYKKKFDEYYRSKMLFLCTAYPNVYPIFYGQFRGLGKIWNDLIINSCYDNIVITNDDVTFLDGFFEEFSTMWFNQNPRTILKVGNENGIPPNIGPAWSTFFVDKLFIDSVGYFNDRYLGIGFEDAEFVRRNGDFPAFITQKYKNLSGAYKDDLVTEGAACWVKYHNFNIGLYEQGDAQHGTNFRPHEKFYMDNRDKFWKNE